MLRLAMMQIGQMIMMGDHDRPGGLAGPLVEEVSSWFENIFK